MAEDYDGYARRYYWVEPDDEATAFVARSLLVRPTDPDKNPLPSARCRIAGDSSRVFDCDDKGVAKIPIPNGSHGSVALEWEPNEADQNADGQRFYYRNSYQVEIRSKDDKACGKRLDHLGFSGGSLAEQVNAYQTFFGQAPTGDLKDIRNELVQWHDGGDYPGIAGGGATEAYSIRLTDPSGVPLPHSQWSADVAGRGVSDTADDEGWMEISLPKTQATVVIYWNDPNGEPGHLYCNEIHLDLDDTTSSDTRRFANLGYSAPTLDEQLAEFCKDFGYPSDTKNETLLEAMKAWHDGGDVPSYTSA